MKNKRRESSKKTPWHLWVIVPFFMFIYVVCIYDYFMMLSHNEAYYNAQGFGAEVHQYFTDYPLPFLALCTINIFSASIAVILIMFRSRWTVNVAFIVFVSKLLLDILTFALSQKLIKPTLEQWCKI